MGQHELFLSRLIALVEYAEDNHLNVAAQALTAAAEIVASSLHDGGRPIAICQSTIVEAKVFNMLDFRGAGQGEHRVLYRVGKSKTERIT